MQLTDCHLFGEAETSMLGVNTDASLRAVLGQIEADHKRPDLVLATGDLSQDGEVAAYQRLAGMLQASPALAGARIRCLPGNHDAPDTLRRALPAWSEPVTDVGAWRVICLDTTVPGSNGGHLPDSQLDLLESALAEAPERPALVATHHNAMPITHWHDTMMIDNPQRLFQLLARWARACCGATCIMNSIVAGTICASWPRPRPASSSACATAGTWSTARRRATDGSSCTRMVRWRPACGGCRNLP